MSARDLEVTAYVFIGMTIAFLLVATVTGSPLPVLPAVLATAMALLFAKLSDRKATRR